MGRKSFFVFASKKHTSVLSGRETISQKSVCDKVPSDHQTTCGIRLWLIRNKDLRTTIWSQNGEALSFVLCSSTFKKTQKYLLIVLWSEQLFPLFYAFSSDIVFMLKPFCLYQSYKVGLVTEFIDSFLGELIFYTSRVNLYSRSSILKKTFIQSCPCTSKCLKQCLFVFENNRDASYFFPNWFSVEQINSIFFLSTPAGSYLQPRKLIYCSQRLCS